MYDVGAGFEPLGGGGGGDVVPQVAPPMALAVAEAEVMSFLLLLPVDTAVAAEVRREAGRLTGPLTPASWRRLSLQKFNKIYFQTFGKVQDIHFFNPLSSFMRYDEL